MRYKTFLLATLFSAGLLATPAQADVKAGVNAWSNGDYTAAIKQWQQPAEKGDADAQFNMGQAYRLGRGVEMNLEIALEWFGKAARQGHVKASDNYGLVLFQTGRRAESIPYLKASVARGEPRAQYILGTAAFNGEFVDKDWVRAYALMTRASAAGVPAAGRSLTQMDQFISPEQKQQALALASQMEQQAREREKQLADLRVQTIQPASTPKPIDVPPSTVKPAVIAAPAMSPAVKPASATPSKPAVTLPSTEKQAVAAKPEAVAPKQVVVAAPKAEPAKPAKAKPGVPVRTGGSFTNPDDIPGYVPSVPARGGQAGPQSTGASYAASDAAIRRPVQSSIPPATTLPVESEWRIQLAATESEAEARAMADRIEAKVPALTRLQYYLDTTALPYVRLQSGPFASKADADAMCATIKAAGFGCFSRRK